MRSIWIEHNGKKIFYQDFSKHFYNSSAVRADLTGAACWAKTCPKIKRLPRNAAIVLRVAKTARP